MIALVALLLLQNPRVNDLTAQFNAGQTLQVHGDRAGAKRVFDHLLDVYNANRRLGSRDLTAVGNALRALKVYDPQRARDALRVYDEAIAADSNNLEARLALADLFLDAYNGTDARETLAAILARHPREPRALLGMARVARFEGSDSTNEYLRRSLAANPNLAPARVLLAQLHLETENYAGALAEIDRALAIDPASVEALEVLAAAGYLQRDSVGFAAAVARVREIDSTDAGLYTTLAEVSARGRLYHEAARFAERATRLDSQSWHAYSVLGINQLRLGQMAQGRTSLEAAFRGDPYDVWTKNTLDLLDTLARFDSVVTRHFVLFMGPDESALMSLYAPPLAEQAWQQMAGRYGVQPAAGVRVEIYPNHADFSVRSVGLAGLGALGVSFGRVIAMDSPSARRPGTFNWGETLWHEIAHVFHMEVSAYRVPRWFTEGLAVLEERRARPGWGEDLSVEFLAAYRAGRIHRVSRLNDGFVRPAYPQEVPFSYYDASLVCEYIEQTAGSDATVRILRAYGQGQGTEDAIRAVLEISMDTLDVRFDAWMRARFAAPLAALAAGDTATAKDRVAAMINRLPDDAIVMAGVADSAHDSIAARLLLEQALYVAPLLPSLHVRLASLAERSGRHEIAVRERKAILALRPVDRADAFYRLANAQLAAGQLDDAKRSVMQSLELAPGFDRAQDLLLTITARQRGN